MPFMWQATIVRRSKTDYEGVFLDAVVGLNAS